MIRTTPCEFYIKCLLLDRAAYTTDAIRKKLSELALDDLGSAYIERLRASLEIPEVFKPHDRRHRASAALVRRLRLTEYFWSEPTFLAAEKLLKSARVKEFVETMMVSRAPFHAMVDYLSRHYGVNIEERDLETYWHYFWNLDLVDVTDIRALVAIRADAAMQSPDEAVQATATAYRRAAWKDPRRTSANLPSTQLSGILAQMRMGISPKSVDIKLILERLQETVLMRAFEAASTGGPDDAQIANLYMVTARIISDRMEDYNDPQAKVLESINAIRLQSSNKKIPLLSEVTDGKHTTDLTAVTKETT